MSEPKEMVNHPSHYNLGPKEADGTAKYEAIKVIEDWSLGFKLGNALKYVLRAPHKGTEEQDLNKARWYLDRHVLCPDHPDRDGPEWSMAAVQVAEAWGLPDALEGVVRHIRIGDAKNAIVLLDSYVISRAARDHG